MSGIKKHNNHAHEQTYVVKSHGHSYKYLLCDSKDHHHGGKHVQSRYKGFEQYLIAIDGVKVSSAKTHSNHHNTVSHTHSHHAAKHNSEEHISARAHNPAHKKRNHSSSDHLGGGAAHTARHKARKSSVKPTETPNPAADAQDVAKTAPTAANPKGSSTTAAQQPTLAQLIASGQGAATKYPIGQDGKATTDSPSGVAITKNEAGKLVAVGEMMQSIDLSSTDPANLSPEDKANIEAAIKSGKLIIGNLSEAATGVQPPNTPTSPAPAGAPNGEIAPAPTTVQPATGANGTPTGSTTSPDPAVVPATDLNNGTPAAK